MAKWLLGFALLCYTFSALGQSSTTINIDFKETPIKVVLQYLETEYGVKFSYKNEVIPDVQLTVAGSGWSLDQTLSEILQTTNLGYEIVQSKYVLLFPEEKAIEWNLCGRVLDRNTGEPLAFASISLQNGQNGTYTEESGKFTLSGFFSEQDTVLVSYVGYQGQQMTVAQLTRQPCKNIFLGLALFDFPKIIITEYLADGIDQSTSDGHISIRPEKMDMLPGLTEADVLQSIQLLPGVSSPNETASGIYIRGGTPDQNLILWDGIPMYHSGHFFGSISAFNPAVVDDVKVYRGGFGPQYGGRVSGVIDISSTEKIPEQISMGVGVNLTHGDVFAKIPLFKQKSALILSFRRSFTDIWQTPTFRQMAKKVFQGTKIGNTQEEAEEDENLDLT